MNQDFQIGLQLGIKLGKANYMLPESTILDKVNENLLSSNKYNYKEDNLIDKHGV